MEDKEKILTGKIISDARARAAAVIKEAETAAEEQLEKARLLAAERRAGAVSAAHKQAAELIMHRASLCRLEISREELKVRRGIVDGAFSDASDRLFALPDDRYRETIGVMIRKHAKNGEAVQAGRGDEKRITRAFVEAVAKSMKIDLKYSDTTGDFKGGIKLLGGESDKNLTFSGVFKTMRDELEAGIAEILFR